MAHEHTTHTLKVFETLFGVCTRQAVQAQG